MSRTISSWTRGMPVLIWYTLAWHERVTGAKIQVCYRRFIAPRNRELAGQGDFRLFVNNVQICYLNGEAVAEMVNDDRVEVAIQGDGHFLEPDNSTRLRQEWERTDED